MATPRSLSGMEKTARGCGESKKRKLLLLLPAEGRSARRRRRRRQERRRRRRRRSSLHGGSSEGSKIENLVGMAAQQKSEIRFSV